jgi:hypothetical protein
LTRDRDLQGNRKAGQKQDLYNKLARVIAKLGLLASAHGMIRPGHRRFVADSMAQLSINTNQTP